MVKNDSIVSVILITQIFMVLDCKLLERVADLFPVHHRPKLFQPLFLSPYAVSGAHPRVFVDGNAEEWVQSFADSYVFSLAAM